MFKIQWILLIIFMMLLTHIVEAGNKNRNPGRWYERRTDSYKAEKSDFDDKTPAAKSEYAAQRFTENAKSIDKLSKERLTKRNRQNGNKFKKYRRKLLADIDAASQDHDIIQKMKTQLEKFLKLYPKDAKSWKFLINVCGFYLGKPSVVYPKKFKNVEHRKEAAMESDY